jgi:putative MATE family efflux protein
MTFALPLTSPIKRLIAYYHDGEYFRLLARFALPIALQYLLSSSLNMAAVMMIGQLGETAVAAVGLANQIWFLMNLVVFGVVSGAAMFVAQLWGKKDIPGIRRVLGLTVKLGLGAALLFWFLATFYPASVLRLYTTDPAVIEQGKSYLHIVAWSYGLYALSAAYYAVLRATGNVRLPLIVSSAALILNVGLAYPLIFGLKTFGLPAMGTDGAALATLIARLLECFTVLALVYRNRSVPAAASLRDLIEVDLRFMSTVLKPILPVIANETLWSLGITTYNAIYGRIGTQAVAAINIIGTIEQMAFVLFFGLGQATAILIGHQIGAGEPEKAYQYGGRSLGLQGSGALLMGGLAWLFAGSLFQVYKVSPEVIASAQSLLTVMALGFWVKACNHVIIIGILRSGGDTRFSLILDGLVIWLVGVPAAAVGAFLFHLPVQWVYALTLSEEVVKFTAGLWRYFSKRWINDLTQNITRVDVPSETVHPA